MAAGKPESRRRELNCGALNAALFVRAAVVVLAAMVSQTSVAQQPKPAAGSPRAADVMAPAPPLPLAATANPIRVLLAPELETTLVAPMQGRIAQLNAGLGQAIANGKPVVVFDCGEQQARLRIADAEHVSAVETLKAKEGLKALNAAGDVEVALARAAVDKAKGAVDLAKVQISYCQLEAPFAGRVAKIHVKPHQSVPQGAPLVEMVSDGPLKLRLNVPSTLLRAVRVGSAFRVTIDETGRTYAARITAVNARVDAVAQTVEMEGSINQRAPELLSGMSGVASF